MLTDGTAVVTQQLRAAGGMASKWEALQLLEEQCVAGPVQKRNKVRFGHARAK